MNTNRKKLQRARDVSRTQPVLIGPVRDDDPVLCRSQSCMSLATTAVKLPAGMTGPDSPETVIVHCAEHQDEAMAYVAKMIGLK